MAGRLSAIDSEKKAGIVFDSSPFLKHSEMIKKIQSGRRCYDRSIRVCLIGRSAKSARNRWNKKSA